VNVLVRSGDELEVSFVESDGAVTSVTLAGPAEFVFEGKIEL
jgi:diaminopimelate epimerase